MAELSEEQVIAKNVETAGKVWKDLGGSHGDSEKLTELLEKVGPAAYNDFVHSSEYTETEGQVVEQPVKTQPEGSKAVPSRASGGSKAGDQEVVIKD